MIEKIRQRLQSKTYQTAMALALLSAIEVKAQFVSGFLPVEYRAYLLFIWPFAMLTLREITTGALADK